MKARFINIKRTMVSFVIFSMLFQPSVSYSEENSGQKAVAEKQADISIKAVSDNMERAAENDSLILYINPKTTEVGVKDKRTGFIWHTNPENRDRDSLASGINKEKLSSQISITYYDSAAQLKEMNNYTDSISLGQFEIKNIKNGVRVDYRIGKEEEIFIVPLIISRERMEEKILKHITSEEKSSLLRNYRFLALKDIKDEAQKKELLAKYPNLADTDLYVLYDTVRDYKKKEIQELIISKGYTLEDMNKDHVANKVQASKGNLEVFKVPLEYTLEGENLVVRVPSDDIEYHREAFNIYQMQLLEFFGAGGKDDKGYMLVPDASGSLIYLNNNKLNTQPFITSVYGQDKSLPHYDRTNSEQAYLPVFGMKRADNAFFAIIEAGDAMTRVWADISGRKNSYNYVYPEFTITPNDRLYTGGYSGNKMILVHQARTIKDDIKVRYGFLKGKDSDYTDMARYYQKYLVNRYNLQRIRPKGNIPFYLETVGAINIKKSVMGIPMNTVEPLTTYREAMDIMNLLNKGRVNNIVLRYTGWANGGVQHTIPASIGLISKLGGTSDFSALQAYLNEKGYEFYPDFGFIYVYKNTLLDGFFARSHASRAITDEIAVTYPYVMAVNMLDMRRDPYYIISPNRIPAIVDSMIEEFKKLSLSGISVKDAGREVNSDFNKENLVDRQQAAKVLTSQFEKLRKAGMSLMSDGGNAYAVPYANHLVNVPLESNRFHITDESIPFYEMVIRGYADYAGEPINMASDYQLAFLKSIETGGGIYFCLMHAENSVIKQTDYHNYYSNDYRVWLDRAIDFYRRANIALGDVHGQLIINHQKLQDNVVKTTFENGREVVVNYGEKAVVIDGVTINARDFTVVKR